MSALDRLKCIQNNFRQQWNGINCEISGRPGEYHFFSIPSASLSKRKLISLLWKFEFRRARIFLIFCIFFLHLNRNLKLRKQKARSNNRWICRARKWEAKVAPQIILKAQGVGGWKERSLYERLVLSSLFNKPFFSFGTSRFLLTGIEYGKWILQQ